MGRPVDRNEAEGGIALASFSRPAARDPPYFAGTVQRRALGTRLGQPDARALLARVEENEDTPALPGVCEQMVWREDGACSWPLRDVLVRSGYGRTEPAKGIGPCHCDRCHSNGVWFDGVRKPLGAASAGVAPAAGWLVGAGGARPSKPLSPMQRSSGVLLGANGGPHTDTVGAAIDRRPS